MERIIDIRIIENYDVNLTFADGYAITIDLREFINKGFARELLDEDRFKEVFIESGGGLAWPNGFDICPNFLRNYSNARRTA